MSGLPSNALIVAFAKPTSSKYPQPKSRLEHSIATELKSYQSWMAKSGIDLEKLNANTELLNQALDSLLSSNTLQTEFMHKTTCLLQAVSLAQPMKLQAGTIALLDQIRQLEHHVQVLSPSFLSDHIVNSNEDGAFLLRDITGGNGYGIEAITNFTKQLCASGKTSLAAALEARLGYVRI